MGVPAVMKKSNLKNHERHLRWEKNKVDKAVNQVLMESAVPIAQMMVEVALTDRNPNVGDKILDRLLGKARQNIGLDGGADDKPIVFMPAQLMAKYAIKAAKYTQLKGEEDAKGDDTVAMLREPLEEL